MSRVAGVQYGGSACNSFFVIGYEGKSDLRLPGSYTGCFESGTIENASPNFAWLLSFRACSQFLGTLEACSRPGGARARSAIFTTSQRRSGGISAEAIPRCRSNSKQSPARNGTRLTGLYPSSERLAWSRGGDVSTAPRYQAAAYYKRAVQIRKKLLKPDDRELVSSLCGLAQALREEGNSTEADQYNREILAIYQQHPEIYRGDYAMYLLNVGVFALRRHRLEEAQASPNGGRSQFRKV